MPPTSVGGANALGQVTGDYVGSRNEYDDYVIDTLIRNYKTGAGGLPGYGDASIGQPNQADFGTPERPLSPQTQKYFEDYVTRFAGNDPWILDNFGQPPGRGATYQQDPNSPAAVTGSYADRARDSAAENALDRASSERIAAGNNAVGMAGVAADRERTASNERVAGMQEAGATSRVQMQIEGSWREAMLADATRRYVAEGDWGVQKWVTSENNTAAMARLQMQLQFDREALAQQAVVEKQRHHEQMIGLALEVAKYDAELAGSPRNWLKYAGWLKSRNVIVNGMTLAMAAQEVNESEIDPGTVAESTGSNVAAIAAQTEAQQIQTGGQSGGATSTQNAFGADMQELLFGADQTHNGQPVNATATPTMGQQQATPSPEELAGVTDYSAFAKKLLGMNPLAPATEEASVPNLEAISAGLQTGGGQRKAGFGAWTGPTTNALGMNVNEISGKDTNYKQFASLLPTEQEMKVGEVASIRGDAGISDWVAEMERSRPKGGGGSGSLAWG